MQIINFSVGFNVLMKFLITSPGIRLQKQISSLIYLSRVLVNILTKIF